MTEDNFAKATSNAQAGSRFLAEAIVAASNALTEGKENAEKRKKEVEQHISCARQYFESMFSTIDAN